MLSKNPPSDLRITLSCVNESRSKIPAKAKARNIQKMSNHATAHTKRAIEEFAKPLPFHDKQDFADAEKGFVGKSKERQIKSKDGHVVWDLDAYDFMVGHDCPDTANPSLWRQGQLVVKDGLFEVCPGIYQLRGFDLSVMTVVEGKTGVIVIDPLTCAETSAAAFALFSEHRGKKPIHALIYTHSHVCRFTSQIQLALSHF